MPFYEYHCANCGHHHEELQKVTDKPLRKCPACGKNKLNRLISAPVFRLKGGGWYETDFKSDKEKQRNLAGEKDTGGEGKSDGAEKAPSKEAGKEAAKPVEKPSGKTTVPVKKPAAGKAKPAAKKATARRSRAGSARSK